MTVKVDIHVACDYALSQDHVKPLRTAMQPQTLFVNYTHPNQQGDRQQRQKVASYIGTYYRNRSKPQARRKGEPNPARPDQQQASIEQAKDGQQQASGMQVLNWRVEPRKASLLNVHDMHGLKVDPFKSYPIPHTKNLPIALEYFLEVYGPAHLLRSHLSRFSPPENFLKTYVQYAMQNPAMFGSIITLSFATMRITLWNGGQPDSETSRYYGNTLASLRKALKTSDGISEDATIMAVLSLIRFEYLVGNAQAYQAHSIALRGLIAQRGGIEEIGWQDIFIPAVAGAITRAKFFMKVSTPVSNQAILTSGGSSLDQLEPYSPTELSRRLAPGIQLLADAGRLSENVIRLAKATFQNPAIDLRHNHTAAKNAYNTELTEYLEHLLDSEMLSLPDEILLISIHRELYDLASNERYSVLYKGYVTYWTKRSLEIINKISPEDTPLVEMFIWTCFKHAGTMVAPFLSMMSEDTSDARFQLMLRVMSKFWQARDWPIVEVLLMRFGPMRECLHWWHLIWRKVRMQFTPLIAK